MGLLPAADIAVFGLVLARVSGLLIAAPIFGAQQLPAHSKIGLALVISLIFTPMQAGRASLIPPGDVAYAILAGREALIGLSVGFAVALIFTGIQMGSRLVGVQMGFGLGGVINPNSGVDGGVMDAFYSVLATVIFLTANGHHAVLAALARTFDLSPIADAQFPAVNPIQVMALIQQVFVVALRIALPVTGALLLADVGLGMIGRAAPQMQVIVVGAPVKIMVGVILLAASTPTTVMLMQAVFRNLGHSIPALIGG
jgi:flagellar biosynthetic protein FliR